MKFRNLNPDEIEVRVQSIKKDNQGIIEYAILLLYKNARVDMDLLDETVGAMNWQREHNFKDGKLYCKVSVWDDEKKHWVTKEDVGTESNTEQEKGQASDSFKRACVNLGIGRELYTSPVIYIKPVDKSETFKNTKFKVSKIKYDNKNQIIGLEIADSKGNRRYSKGYENN